MKVILCVDAGHGGPDPGAIGDPAKWPAEYGYRGVLVSKNALRESDLTEWMAQEIHKWVTPTSDNPEVIEGVEVVLLERPVPIGARFDYLAEILPKIKADNPGATVLFVSLHWNSAENPEAHGFETFTAFGLGPSVRWQGLVHGAVLDKLRLFAPIRDRGHKETPFAVLKAAEQAQVPGVLIEFAFLSNPRESVEWGVKGWMRRDRCAEAILRAALAYPEGA